MNRTLIVVGAVAALVAGPVTGIQASPGSPVRDALEQVVAAGVPGSYAAVVDGGATWRGSAGVGDLRTGRAPDPRGRVRVASVTKTFVAVVVLQLVGEGRLGLDDPIADHLPGLLPYAEPITVRQLLGHTSGVPRDIAHWQTLEEVDTKRWEGFEPAELVRRATDGVPLLFAPGTGFSYSNTGYTVLGLLVERITGRSLAGELERRVFRPLHLRDTSFPSHQPFLPRPAARGYERLYGEQAPLTDVTTYVWSRLWASGNVISSPDDLNRFFRALLGGRLLPAEQLARMKEFREGALGPIGYGLGLMRLPSPCGGPDLWGHGGDLPGYNTWSLHTTDLSGQVSAGMNQDITAPVAAHQHVLLTVVPAALCGEAPTAVASTGTEIPYLGPTLP
ncbi:serine hydrolase domain-containing protein [Saccharothrix lopnurensis]|uniref:Serine hydrolase domain-containing protein n=1 Tax=Saccharothrix lopnurensis TaxID=1670621 RepID=A0ABW1PAD0_9PSEU